MKKKKKPELHMVNMEDPADKAIYDIIEEIREENDLLDELEDKIRRHKLRFIRRIAIALTAIILILFGGYMFVTHQTYHKVRVLETYSNENDSGEQYTEFAGGILKYSRDGAALMSRKGKEKWNSSYQIQNPIVSVNDSAAAVADKSGNTIVVLGKKGLKGEIQTSLPIEKIVVSGQGIVGAVLKDDQMSRIICYDAAGNILVEHKTSATGTGYPLDLAISEDGYMLMVSYLLVENGKITSKVSYYNFGEEGKKKNNYLVAEDSYEGMVIPSVFFLDGQTSVVAADQELMIYEGKTAPKKSASIPLEEGTKSIFHDDKYIGTVEKNEKGNVVNLYSRNGKKILSETFEGEYNNIKIEKGQIIMYDGKKCNIIMKSGVHRFEGEFESDILNIIPLFGINKYLVINANGFEEIRFAK